MKDRFRTLGLVFLSTIVLFTMSACGGSSGPTSPSVSSKYTVSGAFTLPSGKTLSDVAGKSYIVGVTTDFDSEPVLAISGTISGTGSTVDYTLNNIPAGDYYLMALIYQTGSGEDLADGDYVGVYGWDGMSDPEVSVTKLSISSDISSMDFSQIICGCD